MLTEQEVLAHLNNTQNLSAASIKLVNKLKILDATLKNKESSIKDLQKEVKSLEYDSLKIRGAISILIELIAEEEGLIKPL